MHDIRQFVNAPRKRLFAQRAANAMFKSGHNEELSCFISGTYLAQIAGISLGKLWTVSVQYDTLWLL